MNFHTCTSMIWVGAQKGILNVDTVKRIVKDPPDWKNRTDTAPEEFDSWLEYCWNIERKDRIDIADMIVPMSKNGMNSFASFTWKGL